jgi:NAD(P)-dependent dehydrogenase (short-subunit alcohol dehydrogenase family)
MDFSGRVAVVTGATRGLGREIAVSLGSAGARVRLVGRSAQGLEETKRHAKTVTFRLNSDEVLLRIDEHVRGASIST